jgi:PAS domain S-box-containing protein
MTWQYQYTPYIWPMLASAMFVMALGVYAWRRRSVPGALPFVLVLLFRLLWAVGAALELAAVDVPTQIFWVKFQSVWQLPAITAELCFALDYANLRRWLTRRTLTLLAIPPLLVLLLALTNDTHHWIWQGFSFEGYVRPARGSANWILTGYGYLLALMDLGVFAWLFIRSPLHRWPVVLCVGGQFIVHVASMLDAAKVNLVAPMDPAVLAEMFTAAMYALALFRFRMFDPIPVARETVIEQMREGMLVLDNQQRIVDLNSSAEKILGLPAARVKGQPVAQVLPACSDLSARLDDPRMAQSEISMGIGHAVRSYALHFSPLRHRRGFPLGHLLLLYDVTEQKWVQAQLVEQQRALATLQERDQVARELHDSLGQVLGYVKMQAQAAREQLARAQFSEADGYLAQLVAVAQDAHADVREYILGSRVGLMADAGFFPALKQYVRQFGEIYGITAELSLPPELADGAFEPMVEAQLLRIIQEALTNVRKHTQARGVRVSLSVCDTRAEAIVQDDGAGFDPALLETAEGQKFGLRFMRERAEEVGGSVQVHSAPGEGTQVVISVPLRKGSR